VNFSHQLAVSQRHWLAANRLIESQTQLVEFWEAVGLLQGFSCEIALKCFLSLTGLRANQLKKKDLRHNLEALLQLAASNGLSLPQRTIEIIGLLSPSHSSYFFRYGVGEIDVRQKPYIFQTCDQRHAQMGLATLHDILDPKVRFVEKLEHSSVFEDIIQVWKETCE
jgi:hypothetical protein